MSLLVPPEMIQDINSYSGFLNMNSKFGNKNTKGLFYTIENRKYLVEQVYSLLTNIDFVRDTLQSIDAILIYDRNRTGAKQSIDLVKQFSNGARPLLAQRMQSLIEAWKLPYREDHAIRNPIMELGLINREFITTTASTIIQSPDCIMPNYYDIDPNTGKVDAPEWDYGASSWADGTWHPEHLFTESKRNRSNPYWTPRNVTFDTNPPPGDDAAEYNNRPTAFHPRAVHYKSDRATRVQPSKRQKHIASGLREQFMPTIAEEALPPTIRPNFAGANQIDSNWVDVPNIQDLLEEQSYPYVGEDGFSTMYHVENSVYAPGPGPGNRYRYDFYGKGGFSTGGTFPRWQTSVNDRPYQRDTSEGLREGGSGDRRVQRPSGYDMSALTTKSSY